ncbi:unnamed protein product [Arctia plantaginis]|uniref:Uncharacterized protein n=1 Tax=Arctia plantaginis TaxID=874455 RepID=A0A8S0ZD62_ARCPL|nr:unnamed protein product [Arctia plantaginis]
MGGYTDPRKIIQEFLRKAKEGARGDRDTSKEMRSPGGLTFHMYEKNDAPTDLLFLITLFLERGNNISKILLKCDPEMGSLIRRKASAYEITVEKKSSTVLGRLSKAVSSFPHCHSCTDLEA